MTIRVPTYAQRVARIQRPGDEDVELRRAKDYVRRLKRAATKAFSRQEKKELLDAVREAEIVLRRMRANIYALEGLALARLRTRQSARQDAEIMRLRCLAASRGATPVEVQRNIHRIEEPSNGHNETS